MNSAIQKSPVKKFYTAATALLGWFGLVLQFYLSFKNETSGISLWGRFFNFFSYFTILTNILVALSLTLNALNSQTKIGRFFNTNSVQSALTVYIFIVGTVYYILLRNIWKPEGWQLVADAILHYVTPVVYLFYWLLFIPKGKLKFNFAVCWMIYPALYFIYSLIRGVITNWYPYPFIDVKTLGYNTVLLNAVLLLAVFMVIVLVFVALDKLLGKKLNRT